MTNDDMSRWLRICENRLPDAEYEESKSKVIAKLKSYDSQTYTKLGQKLERIDEVTKQLKTMQEEVKLEVKERLAGIFDANDAAQTRVVETMRFIFTLTADPKQTETPKYKDILAVLEKQLTPELLVVLENLRKTMKTVSAPRPPSLKYSSREIVDESDDSSAADQYEGRIMQWAESYDRKLNDLRDQSGCC